MDVCYLDEAGCAGRLPSVTSPVQPVLVIGGIMLARDSLHALTHDFLLLKKRFFPNLLPNTEPYLHWVLPEIKGSDVRTSIRTGHRNERRHAFGFLDHLLDLLTRHDVQIVARVWVKAPAQPFDGRAVYTSSVQALAYYFHHRLVSRGSEGSVILDSRTKSLNAQVSFSVFTEKFRSQGDKYPRLVEMPTFGHSENHAGLQLADVVCSTLIYPMTTRVYSTGYVQSVHVNPKYQLIKDRYAERLNTMQYRFQDPGKRWRGGVTVSDAIAKRSGSLLFA